eukprot:355561-Chlamydomonas_euryale.AAC.2
MHALRIAHLALSHDALHNPGPPRKAKQGCERHGNEDQVHACCEGSKRSRRPQATPRLLAMLKERVDLI